MIDGIVKTISSIIMALLPLLPIFLMAYVIYYIYDQIVDFFGCPPWKTECDVTNIQTNDRCSWDSQCAKIEGRTIECVPKNRCHYGLRCANRHSSGDSVNNECICEDTTEKLVSNGTQSCSLDSQCKSGLCDCSHLDGKKFTDCKWSKCETNCSCKCNPDITGTREEGERCSWDKDCVPPNSWGTDPVNGMECKPKNGYSVESVCAAYNRKDDDPFSTICTCRKKYDNGDTCAWDRECKSGTCGVKPLDGFFDVLPWLARTIMPCRGVAGGILKGGHCYCQQK